MLLEHERNYDLGMDALGTVRTAGAKCLTCCMRGEAILVRLCDKQSPEA